MLLIDGVKYYLHEFKEERELESAVEEHVKDIFGEESIYFGKKKISSLPGIGSIPDGYAVTFWGTPRWYVVEVELSSHPIFEHIVPQINKFINGIKNDATKRELINYMDKEIRSQPIIDHLIKERFGEVYRFLSDLIYKSPTILIIVDEKTKVLDDVVSSIPVETKILEFKTFGREGVGLAVHAHLFNPMYAPTILKPKEKKPPCPRRALTQILEVVKLMKEGKSYSEACKTVAQKFNLKTQTTVRDACTRRLGVDTDKFIKLYEKGGLVPFLLNMFPNEKDLIDRIDP
jgi:hypothetical protein